MNFRRAFEIAFVGLKPGVHVFDFKVDDQFFSNYGPQEFSNCHADIRVELDKQNGFMLLKFDVGGSADVTCDRCGNQLTLPLWEEFRLIVKMTDDPDTMNGQEEDPDIFYISRGESHLQLADWVYEFVNLSIPLQKMCAEDEVGGPQCNLEALARLNQMTPEKESPDNPLWKGLEKFRDGRSEQGELN